MVEELMRSFLLTLEGSFKKQNCEQTERVFKNPIPDTTSRQQYTKTDGRKEGRREENDLRNYFKLAWSQAGDSQRLFGGHGDPRCGILNVRRCWHRIEVGLQRQFIPPLPPRHLLIIQTNVSHSLNQVRFCFYYYQHFYCNHNHIPNSHYWYY